MVVRVKRDDGHVPFAGQLDGVEPVNVNERDTDGEDGYSERLVGDIDEKRRI